MANCLRSARLQTEVSYLGRDQHTGVQSASTAAEVVRSPRLSGHAEDCVQYDHSDVFLSATGNKAASK